MDRELELRLIRRCLDRVRAGGAERGEAERSSPVARYLDEERFDAELRRVFRPSPSAVAHRSELAEPGDFLTLECFGRPVLLTRKRDGSLGAFLNVCRHRGTRLVGEPRGHRARFACPYHAWTYDLDGALVGVRHQDGFPTLERADRGLVGLAVEERHGLVWLTVEGSPDLGSFLGRELGRDFDGLGLGALEPFEPEARVWRANWKLLVEGGLEAYHFQVAHSRTIAPLFTDGLFVADRLGPHFRTVLIKRTLRELDEADESDWSLLEHANVLYTVFPTAAFIAQTDHVVWVRFRPLAVDRTEITVTLLVPPGRRDARSERYWRRNRELTLATLAEDFALGESIQSTLGSGANRTLRFGRYEHLLGELHDTVDELLGVGST